MTRTLGIALVGLAVLCAPGCGLTSARPTIVMLDSSLRGVAPGLEAAFEARRADFEVDVITGPVDQLLEQVLQGIPADVVIGPGALPTDRHYDEGLPIGEPVAPASVQIAIVTPRDTLTSRPLGIADLTGQRVVIADGSHPLGVNAMDLLADDQVASPDALIAEVVSVEPDGPAVVARVLAGGVDAGIALLPDALAATDVRASVPDGSEWRMPVQAVVFSRDADAFVEFLASDEAQRILRDAGFDGP